MVFPVSGVEINPFVPPLVAFIISIITSMGGVSGAFLLLPFQMSVLGFNSPSVSATNHLFNILAIPGGLYRFIREGRMLWPLALIILIGSIPGTISGGFIRLQFLPDPKNFKFFVAIVLFYIGGRMVLELCRGGKSRNFSDKNINKQPLLGYGTFPSIRLLTYNLHSIRYEYKGQEFSFNVMKVLVLSIIVGIIGGVYGIGGGAIIAPFLVSIVGLPVHTIAGAALMGTFVTSLTSVLFFQLVAPWYPTMTVAPDWLLGFLFGLGGFAGIYCGARLQKYVPAQTIKWVLVGCILIPASRYLLVFLF